MRGKLFQIHTIFKVPVLSKQEQEKRACLMYHLGERSVRIREVESSNLFRSTRLQGLPAKGKILTSVRVFLFPQKLFDSQKRKSCLWSCRYFDASRGFFWAGDSRRCWNCFVCLGISGGNGNRFMGCFQIYLGQHQKKE